MLLGGEESIYFYYGDYVFIGDRVRADVEVFRGVFVDDTVDGVLVWRVGLISVYYGEVCDYRFYSVFGDFFCIL